ncbi:dehydrogenase/ reductase 1 [Microscilla marina ATCC 23134]|uniref:Dehydrogenase/ reductase 1 n=2 Tax=Microscilla marina TaxID=1027 RepID=A1ZQT0_MICM2|nr:dehydrogenase/ reductase 1 [Microscilla marina ATCC 23134]
MFNSTLKKTKQMITNTIETLHLETVLNNHAQDMTGKVVAITGTTSGTGFVCAREVAKKGAKVLLLNRQSERAEQALKQLQNEVPNGKFEAVTCDLQDFDSVRNAIDTIKAKHEVIDVLVNNAGVMALEDKATKDGYDVQMQTNVISHFLLTKELFPLLKKSPEARVVNHSSMARLGGPLVTEYFEKKGGDLGGDGTEEQNLSFQGPRWERYHQTKLANATFTYGLKKKLEEANINHVIPLLAHPGLAKTQLQVTSATAGGMDNKAELMNMAQSAEDGATGIIRAAMDPKAKPGDFFGPSGQGWKGFPEALTPEELLVDEANLRTNWEGCEKAVGTFEV